MRVYNLSEFGYREYLKEEKMLRETLQSAIYAELMAGPNG